MTRKKKNRKNQDAIILRDDTRESLIDGGVGIGASVLGTLVGLVVGGPVGAVVGAAVSPVISTGARIAKNYWERRKDRATKIITNAFDGAGLDETKFDSLADNPELIDDFIKLVQTALDNDKSLDKIFTALVRELVSQNSPNRDRIIIFEDALNGLQGIHLKILKVMYAAGGQMSAANISYHVKISEIELRGIVRTLELKGMIRDLERIPIVWELREMGRAVAEFIIREENDESLF